MSLVYLVSCVAEKAESRRPARDLYVSDWFKKARAYVERIGAEWYILSALYHAVCPETELDPYEFCLPAGNSPDERLQRKVWGRITAACLLSDGKVKPGDTAVILAGGRYREYLIPELRGRGVNVEVPMLGLGIGQQKAWLMRGGKGAESGQ